MTDGPSSGDVVSTDAVVGDRCLNCGRILSGQYCAGCGQKKRDVDPTLREFLHETTQELTNWDGKVPGTLRALFFSPGRLTMDVLAGRRARWLTPLRVYVICSIAFFASRPLAETISQRTGREVAKITITNPDGTTVLTPEMREAIEGGLPARIFGSDRLVRAALNNAELNREINNVLPKGMFILLPVFALLTMAAWRRRLPHYPAHLYLALHMHSAWFGALATLAIVQAFFSSEIAVALLGAAVFLYVTVYGVLVVHRIFGDSWAKTIAKVVVVAVAYSACLVILSLALLAYAVTRM
jgi:Protein of unknown function (DUF3667)